MTTEIVVVSGSYGAGHDAAARALTEELTSLGHVVRRLDVAEELPWRIGVALRWLYFIQLRLLPGSWGATVRWLQRDGIVFRGLRRLLGLLGRRMVRRAAHSGLVISTHPFASQALGEARSRGVLRVPVVTYLTDASVHRLWVHRSVDLHLAIHEVTAAQARDLGGTTAVVRPVVPEPVTGLDPDWRAPWPLDRPAALIVGGSCGVGDLAAAAADVLITGLMTPVVACGNNERLRALLDAVPGVVALGWRDDMRSLVAAAACVLQNAGGMTSLESLAAGTPTLTYRPIPGHGRTNAQALDVAGLVSWVHDPDELERALARILGVPESFGLPVDAPPAVEVLAREMVLDTEQVLVAA